MLISDPSRMESVLFFHSLIFISSVKLFTNKDACLVASLLFQFLIFVLFKIKEACAANKHWCYVFVLFCFVFPVTAQTILCLIHEDITSHACIFVSSPLGTDPTDSSDSGSITSCPIIHSNTNSPHCHSEPTSSTASANTACCPCSSPAASSSAAAGSVHPAPANSKSASTTSHSPC